MRRHGVLVCALVGGSLTAPISAQTPVVFGFLDGETTAYVRRAVAGAATRLGRPRCQAVLTDFSDKAGRRLSITLATSGRSPGEAFARLRILEDRDAGQCFAGTTLAFTEVGSHVIRVCGRYFKERFLGSPRATEIIMIHEFLHTLGLGENPPSSQEITRQVEVRCGD